MTTVRTRRSPPPMTPVEVTEVEHLTPRMVRVTLAGAGLRSWPAVQPGASARLLLPRPGSATVEQPTWTGNEYLYEDGTRPAIRTVTPLRLRAAADDQLGELEVELVRHGSGPLSEWAATARRGNAAALSGPGRGYEPDPVASSFLVAGDESALPAMSELLPALPADVPVVALIELADPAARLPLPDRAGQTIRWLDLLAGAPPGAELAAAVVAAADLDPGVRVWAAGEAASMQRIRRHLFETLGLPRSHGVVRGYWKHGRGGDDGAGGEGD